MKCKHIRCVSYILVLFLLLWIVYILTMNVTNGINSAPLISSRNLTDVGTGTVFTFTYNENAVDSTILERRMSKCLLLGGDNGAACKIYAECDGSGRRGGYINISSPQCKKRLPKCLVIGAFKSGTRELIDFLQINPLIVIRKKPFYEVSFFDKNFHKGLDWYRNEMPESTPDQITIEKTPNYFQSREAPRRIFETDPHMKLILMIREPVARATSHFTFDSYVAGKQYGGEFKNCAFNPTRTDVNKHCKYIQHSIYNTSFVRYLHYFKYENILTINAEEFRMNPGLVLNRVEVYLNATKVIDQDDFVWNDSKRQFCVRSSRGRLAACYDQTRGRQPYLLDENYAQKLRTFFEPFNEQFFNLIGRSFDW